MEKEIRKYLKKRGWDHGNIDYQKAADILQNRRRCVIADWELEIARVLLWDGQSIKGKSDSFADCSDMHICRDRSPFLIS